MVHTPERIAKYVGKPYDKYNCFDLVREFYSDFFSLDLREYYDGLSIPPREVVQSLIVSGVGDFEQVKTPQFGDLIVVRLYGYSCHVGVFVPPGYLLHTIRNVGSCLEPVKKYERLIEGYYRHKPLEEFQA